MIRRIVAWTALALGLLAFIVIFVTPWPSVLLIRAIFDQGAANASAALEKHLPPGLAIQEAISYDPADKDALLDVYKPAALRPDAPTIVWIHGGGFVSGRRGDLTNYLKVLAGRGYAVVNIDYTLAPGARYPTPIRQVTKALGFIDRNAAQLGINRNKLVIAGDSAGAQIAAQVANVVTSPAYAKDVGVASTIRPEQLKGALLYCGVYDVEQVGAGKSEVMRWFIRSVTWAYSGSRDWHDAPGFDRISVARHVTSAFPATFISAGNADPLGPQSLLMDRALRDKGVAVDSLFFPADYQPPLAHEYQFILDGAAGRTALDRSVVWLERLPA